MRKLLVLVLLVVASFIPAALVLPPRDFWGLVAVLAAIVALGLGVGATVWVVAEVRWRRVVAASRKRPGPMGHAVFVAYLEARDAEERGAKS